MSDNFLDSVRLYVMQDVLPIGIAIIDRAKLGGIKKVLDAFDNSSNNPIEDLREEGRPVAESVRDKLDNISPGLGNPIMQVEVAVDDQNIDDNIDSNDNELINLLNRLDKRLDKLRLYLEQD